MNRFWLLFSIFIYASFSLQAQEITYSSQPANGPGGHNYIFDSVKVTDRATTAEGFVLFEPISLSSGEGPEVAPVVVFMHGYGAYNPAVYGKWIDHLVKKGNIVIFPRYQRNLFSPTPDEFIANTIKGIRGALDTLCNGSHLVPDTSGFTMVGHSFGGAIIANMLADWNDFKVPMPKGVFLASPGTGPFKFPLESYKEIPADIKLLIMVSDGDKTVGDEFGILVFETATQTAQRNLLRQVEDDYGYPEITHGHNESYSVHEKFDNGDHGFSWQRAKYSTYDPIDYYGYWKLMDALNDCVRSGKNCHYAFGDTEEQRYLGEWSDGTPITPLRVTLPDQESNQPGKR